MRILAIYRHYWPDTTPYARLLRAILEHLVGEGHAATVFTAQPSYNDVAQPRQPRRERLGNVDIRRLRLLPEQKRWKVVRAVNFLIFLFRAVWHVLGNRKKYDLILANTHPPVLMGVVLRLIRRLTGIPYLYHCQDLHPESTLLAGQLKAGRLSRLMLRADVKSCRAARRVVTLSADMRGLLVSRPDFAADNLAVINNFPLDVYHEVHELPASFRNTDDGLFRVYFAGNMGHFQDLSRLIEAARLLRDESRIQFIFMGAGAVRDRLRRQAADLLNRTVFFEDHQPVETAFACMRRANLGVISLATGVYRVAYPSKTMTYLAAGLPVLAIVEPESNVAREVLEQQFGWVPRSTLPADIAHTIQRAFAERERWTATARAALVDRANRHFGRDRALHEWARLFRQLDQELGPASERTILVAGNKAA